MKIIDKCVVCGATGEDGGHLFFKYKMAKKIWRHLSLESVRKNLADAALVRIAVLRILELEEEQKLLVITALWFIWQERNIIREEGRRRPVELIARYAKTYIHEHRLEAEREQIRASRLVRRGERWQKPPVEFLKLNCDACFKSCSSSGSWGFLIRDSDGDVVITGRGKVDQLLNAFQGELIACLQGIQTAIELGIGKLIVETDAKMVVQALSSNAFDDSAVGVLVAEIKSLASSNFISFKCVFRVRECNRAANELAKLGYDCVQGEEQITSSIREVFL